MGSVFFWTNRASSEVILREASRIPSQLSDQARRKGKQEDQTEKSPRRAQPD